jgi:hypothetical protein
LETIIGFKSELKNDEFDKIISMLSLSISNKVDNIDDIVSKVD